MGLDHALLGIPVEPMNHFRDLAQPPIEKRLIAIDQGAKDPCGGPVFILEENELLTGFAYFFAPGTLFRTLFASWHPRAVFFASLTFHVLLFENFLSLSGYHYQC